MRRFLLMAVLGVWLLWACSSPALPVTESAGSTAANTVVVYKSPT